MIGGMSMRQSLRFARAKASAIVLLPKEESSFD
jgi:hypothetical protein